MDEGLRLHLALCTVAERLAAVMEEARFERRDGYAFVTFPTLPIPSFNGVWPDEDSAATALPDALAEIEANGIAPRRPHSERGNAGRGRGSPRARAHCDGADARNGRERR